MENRIDDLISPYSTRINFDAFSNMYKINARLKEGRPFRGARSKDILCRRVRHVWIMLISTINIFSNWDQPRDRLIEEIFENKTEW